MDVAILPYKATSKSFRRLAVSLGLRGIKLEGSKYKNKEGRLIINWGQSNPQEWYEGKGEILNSIESVKLATNKLDSFVRMKERGVNIPAFYESREDVVKIMDENPKARFIGRTLLCSTKGKGCYLISKREEDLDFAESPLAKHYKIFTQYIPKTAEYRVHVFKGKVFDIAQKRARKSGSGVLEVSGLDYKIRSYERGWVFCRENVKIPEGLEEGAVKAVESLDLDFGAVDMIWNRTLGIFVLEVNTAPALEGGTLVGYTSQFRSFIKGREDSPEEEAANA